MKNRKQLVANDSSNKKVMTILIFSKTEKMT